MDFWVIKSIFPNIQVYLDSFIQLFTFLFEFRANIQGRIEQFFSEFPATRLRKWINIYFAT